MDVKAIAGVLYDVQSVGSNRLGTVDVVFYDNVTDTIIQRKDIDMFVSECKTKTNFTTNLKNHIQAYATSQGWTLSDSDILSLF